MDGMAEIPVIFPACVAHNVMAGAIRQSYPGISVIGAGFVSIGEDQHRKIRAQAYGESVSLNVKCRGQIDTDIINQSLDLSNPWD